jgi:hypothetical protein
MPVQETDHLFSEQREGAFVKALPCDRWVARSCLQKAIRRGNEELAVRALANLFLHDPRAIWRHLIIIALEDVGLADVGAVAEIIAAKSQHQFGRRPGLLWATYARLTERLSRLSHSQELV